MAQSSAWGFTAKGADTDTLTVDIFDVIGGYSWDDNSVSTAKSMRRALAGSKAKTINLTVNSRGGDVTEGMAIYSMLQEHPAKVVASVPGLAASMASVIVMAADEITMSEGAMLMIHNAWGGIMGTPDEMRKHADVLDKMSDTIAGIYTARTGMAKEDVQTLMAAETWMSAADAKKAGFVDKVLPAKKGSSAAKSMARAYASLDLSGFRSVPESFAHAVDAARSEIGGATSPMQNDPNDASEAEREEIQMAEDLKTVLATLGVASVADAAGSLSLLRRIEVATGKTGDEALGFINAALASHAALPAAQKRIGELERAGESSQLEAAVATAKQSNKLTPAIEKEVRAQYEAKDITLKGALAWLSNLAPISALANSKREPAPPPANGQVNENAAAPTWNGKVYKDLKPTQRAELKQKDPELFAAMSAAQG